MSLIYWQEKKEQSVHCRQHAQGCHVHLSNCVGYLALVQLDESISIVLCQHIWYEKQEEVLLWGMPARHKSFCFSALCSHHAVLL
jgi:hypothetical protein